MLLYVADALEPAERDALRRHLATGCVACAAHLAEAQATFAALPLALDPVQPAPELRERLMDRLDAPAATVTHRIPAGFWLSAAAAVVIAVTVTYAAVTRRYGRALADVQLAFNGNARATLLQSALADRDATVEQLRRRLQAQQTLVDALQSERSAVIHLAATGAKPGEARLVWAPTRKRSVLLAQHLAPSQPGRTYELWYIAADQKPVPAGTFAVDATGSATVVNPVPADFGTLAVAAITDEPAGGSPAPTTPPFLAGKVD